jgi:hypothetical protein
VGRKGRQLKRKRRRRIEKEEETGRMREKGVRS